MTKFKVGDRVKVIRLEVGCARIGATGSVVGVNDLTGGVWVDWDEKWQGWTKYMFKQEVELMEYQDKWILNEGQGIPDGADRLEHNGSVVAYRLPVREPDVGDEVRVKGTNTPGKLLYIHQNRGGDQKWGVVVFRGDILLSYPFEDLSLSD
jgi:hypothetical protein